jgi:nucleoside 2-deoxyribosyltransferase
MDGHPLPLLVGEISLDFTITKPDQENKLRLGGIAHAARGFWALKKPFSAAVFLPSYLEASAEAYLRSLGCVDFHLLGEVKGAPNLTIIHDQTEVADQGYDSVLRDEKWIELSGLDLSHLACSDILIFPGSYDLIPVCKALPRAAKLHLDVAYDLDDPSVLFTLAQTIDTILISTSSTLFTSLFQNDLLTFAQSLRSSLPATVILKENRGGSRMVIDGGTDVISLPALLGSTTNSVGVGDVFAAAYVTHLEKGSLEAGWRASYVAAAYSQTTYPDLFKLYVQRDLKLTLSDMQSLGGVFLPWERRLDYDIYLAAPDFTYVERAAVDKAIASLRYHNFKLRRPIAENGELAADASSADVRSTFDADYDLLKRCSLLFAVPTGRDAGTLVEVGMAIEASIPVVVYDPTGENANTMVVAGSERYSADLDACLNAVFEILSSLGERL